MATRVNVCNVDIQNNPATFFDRFSLKITFEVFENLSHDLEWSLTYVGSADDDQHDQLLDSVLVGPVPEGRHEFIFEADAPDPSKIPQAELVGVTVLLLTCAYNNQPFIKIGWYVSNEYTDPELKENPPHKHQLDKLTRTMHKNDVRVTSFAIKWGDDTADPVVEGADTGEGASSSADVGLVMDNMEAAQNAANSASDTDRQRPIGGGDEGSNCGPLTDVTNNDHHQQQDTGDDGDQKGEARMDERTAGHSADANTAVAGHN